MARQLIFLLQGDVAGRLAFGRPPHRENGMTRMHVKGAQGFTLVELMIVVAILGVLASVAIPSFVDYQLRSKRAEAYVNLGALSKTQKSYFAEYNTFISVLAEPLGATAIPPNPMKRDSTGVSAAFADVGWQPEGDVFYDYDTVTSVSDPARCSLCIVGECFTSAAYGDLDGDLVLSVILYAQSDGAGGFCETWLGGNRAPPANAGQLLVDQVVRAVDADDF